MRLRIVNPHTIGATAEVWIDGELQADVVSVDVHLHAKELTTATVTFLVTDLDLDVEATISG